MSKTNKQAVVIAYTSAAGDGKPDAQREAIEKWAKTHRVSIAHFYADDGPAARATVDERKGLMGALLALRTRTAGTLVVSSRNRLAPDAVTLAIVMRLATREDAKIVYVRESPPETEADAKLGGRLVSAFAEYERALMRVRTRAAVAIKRQRGEMTGRCPWGYHLAKNGKSLEPDPHEQNILDVVRHMRASGRKIREIVDALREMGVRGRNGKPIGSTRVFEMIQGGRKKQHPRGQSPRESYSPARS